MRGKKRRNYLSLYMSKLRIKRQNAARASKLGWPRVLKLKKPLSTKDLDSTMSYEQFTTDKCPTDNGEYDNVMEMQFTICCKPEENCVVPRASPPPPPPPSSGTESDGSDSDMWECPYVNYCFQQLRDKKLIRNLVEKLYSTDCLQDFMLLVTQIADGSLNP